MLVMGEKVKGCIVNAISANLLTQEQPAGLSGDHDKSVVQSLSGVCILPFVQQHLGPVQFSC